MPALSLSLLWRVLAFSIPIPISLILAAGLWFQIDKASAIRKAVDTQINRFVGVSEISALEASLKAEKLLTESLRTSLTMARQREERDREALNALSAEKRLSELTIEEQQNEIQLILDQRNGIVPTVADLGIYSRLRWR